MRSRASEGNCHSAKPEPRPKLPSSAFGTFSRKGIRKSWMFDVYRNLRLLLLGFAAQDAQ